MPSNERRRPGSAGILAGLGTSRITGRTFDGSTAGKDAGAPRGPCSLSTVHGPLLAALSIAQKSPKQGLPMRLTLNRLAPLPRGDDEAAC